MKNYSWRIAFVCTFGFWLSPVFASTSLDLTGPGIKLVHRAEAWHYYQSEASPDLENWSPIGMPYFLGNSSDMELPLLFSKGIFQEFNFFVRVKEGKIITPYDPYDGGPVLSIAYTPIYPSELRRSGIEGTVTIEFIINTLGDIVDPFVYSTTDERFNEEALKSINFWKFIPARKDGNPMAARVRQPIVFKFYDIQLFAGGDAAR